MKRCWYTFYDVSVLFSKYIALFQTFCVFVRLLRVLLTITEAFQIHRHDCPHGYQVHNSIEAILAVMLESEMFFSWNYDYDLFNTYVRKHTQRLWKRQNYIKVFPFKTFFSLSISCSVFNTSEIFILIRYKT